MGYTAVKTSETLESLFLSEFNDYKIIEYHKHGNDNRCEIYASIYNAVNDLSFVMVVLMQRGGYEVTYKDMTEFEHPYYYNCPLRILQTVSSLEDFRKAGIHPSNIFNAKQWREQAAKKKNNRYKQTSGNIFKPMQKQLF
jgi:hypothetical protein